MKVRFVQSGGFLGLLKGCEIDTSSLTRVQAKTLQQLIEVSGIAGSGVYLSDSGRDLRQYEITLEWGTMGISVTFDDETLPQSARQLIGYLKKCSKPQPLIEKEGPSMLATFKSIAPEFHKTHDVGYIGFTYYNASFISKGIAYFTRWSKLSEITVSHALVVTGENECIEALGDRDKVEKSPLTKYFDDPRCAIFFRKPLGWVEELGNRIAKTALSQDGAKYDYGLIVADMAKGSFIGHLIDGCFRGVKEDILTKILNNDKRWICSELAAYALDEQPEYHDKGILNKETDTITPQELFEDGTIFTPWTTP